MRGRGVGMATIQTLRRVALRHCVVRDEADDVVQDVLAAAIEAGMDCADSRFLPWACGAVRLRSKFLARGAIRRKRREVAHEEDRQLPPPAPRRLAEDFVEALPPSLRIVALLVNVGLGRTEIAFLLGLPDTALRQRISALRRAVAAAGASAADDIAPASGADGLARRSLKAGMSRLEGRRFAISDPDGHQIFLTSPHIRLPDGNS
ncbi:RNA polymerase sigma factor [Arvimicrobium flavum]|uniref:RNA polymerase sigma factor n=1 Tax=Arvimicrobium flavum TaxID=3393320 RepID=UPI00237BDC5E|nr:transcriptional regulator [Mesorhizobium shangrilense]